MTSIARGKLRERSRSRRRGGSGSGSKGGRRGIEGLDDVEMGPAAGAAMKSFYESGVGGEGSQVVVVGTERCRGGR